MMIHTSHHRAYASEWFAGAFHVDSAVPKQSSSGQIGACGYAKLSAPHVVQGFPLLSYREVLGLQSTRAPLVDGTECEMGYVSARGPGVPKADNKVRVLEYECKILPLIPQMVSVR